MTSSIYCVRHHCSGINSKTFFKVEKKGQQHQQLLFVVNENFPFTLFFGPCLHSLRSQSEIQLLSRGIARNGSRKSQDLEVLPNNLPSTQPSTHGQAHRGAGGGGGGGGGAGTGRGYSFIGPVAEQCLVLAHLYPNFT